MSDLELEGVVETTDALDEATVDSVVDGEKIADDSATDIKKGAPKQTSLPKTKVGMINAMMDAVKGMKKDDISASYESIMASLKVEGFEAEEVSEEIETQSIKEIRQISAEDVVVSEDVEAMFSGQDLSEDFVSKATTIFEAAVVSKVNEIL